MEGDDSGGWRLIAFENWMDQPYALEFDHPKASPSCGMVGPPEAVLAHSGGSFGEPGAVDRYVIGAVLPPVSSVVVSFEDGAEIEVQPRAVEGMRHSFFAVIADAPGTWQVEGRDAGGEVVARSGN